MTMLAEPKPQTVAVQRQFNPMAPIGDAGSLKGMLNAQRDSIAATLPKHITPERLIKTMLVAVNRNPEILKCTQASVMETINRAAELGLDLSGTLGEAYPVPFGGKLQLMIGYRGMEKLAWQSGEVESIDAEVVYEKDVFNFRKGTEVIVEWTPCLTGDRGKPIGAYACVKLKSGGKLARFLPVVEIEKIRNKAQSKNSPAWKDWWDEMARKCALKRTLKDAPLSTERFVAAMEHDDTTDGLLDVFDAQLNTAPQRPALTDRLRQPKQLTDGNGAPVDPEDLIQRKAEQARQLAADRGEGSQHDTADPQLPDDAQSTADQQQADESGEIALNELLEQGPDAIKKALREKYEALNGHIGAKDWNGAMFKFATSKGGADKVTELHWRLLYTAIGEKRFDVKKGVIVAEQ